MKYTSFWLTLAACCAFSVGTAFGQGAGQGQHQAGSDTGNPSDQISGSGGNRAGQGKNGPNGAASGPVVSGTNNNSAGQGKHQAGSDTGNPSDQISEPGNRGVTNGAIPRRNRKPLPIRFARKATAICDRAKPAE